MDNAGLILFFSAAAVGAVAALRFLRDGDDGGAGGFLGVNFHGTQPDTVSRSSPGGWKIPPHGKKYEAQFYSTELHYGLPHNLLARMAQQESNFNENARGAAGEIGLMQIIPKWHPGVDPTSARDSIEYAGKLMRQYKDQFGTYAAAIAAWNWGPTVLSSRGITNAPLTTRKYIADVLGDIGVTTA